MKYSKEEIKKLQTEFKQNPILFFKEVLHFTPDKWQENAAIDLANNPKVSIRSGQGVGKTCFEACIALWFLSCYINSRVVATAPTRQQLNDVLWSELSKWINKSDLLRGMLKWTKTRISVVGNEERWFAVARTATKPENMQGFHEDNMLFIVDEASGVDDKIMEAILGTLSGANNKLLLCGNPNKPKGVFYDSHTIDISMYKTHKVSSLDSQRTNKDNINSLIKKYGESSNVVRVRVYGEFPVDEDDVFLKMYLIDKGVNTDTIEEPIVSIDIASDIARFGEDKTVIAFKINKKVQLYKKIRGQDLMKTAAEIVMLGSELVKKYKYENKIPIRIDNGGIGGGVIDRLVQIQKSNPTEYWWMKVIPINFGMRINHIHYYDTTTYMIGNLKDLLLNYDEDGKEKESNIILPKDDDLIAQLSSRKYIITEDSKVKVESKKDMKKRNLPSPDEADCILLFCYPVANTERRRKEGNNRR